MHSDNFTYLVTEVARELGEQEEVRHRAGYDPMEMTLHGRITQSGFRRVIQSGQPGAVGKGYGFGIGPEVPTSLIDGPTPVNPSTGHPWDGLRITALPPSGLTYVSPPRNSTFGGIVPIVRQTTPGNLGGSFGALLRLTGGTTHGGAQVVREFQVGGSQEAAFEVGELENVRLEMIFGNTDTVVQWQWFDDSTGLVAKTPLWSRPFLYSFLPGVPAAPASGVVAAPDGAVKLYADTDILISWFLPVLGGTGGGTPGNFDTGFNTGKGLGGFQAIGTSTGVDMITPYFELGPAPGSPFLNCNLLFELSPL